MYVRSESGGINPPKHANKGECTVAIHAFGPGDSLIVRTSNEWIRSELSAEHRLVDWTFHGNDGDAIRIHVMKPTYLRVGGYKRIGPVPECDAIYAVRALEIGRPLSRERVGMGWHDGDNFVSKGRIVAVRPAPNMWITGIRTNHASRPPANR